MQPGTHHAGRSYKHLFFDLDHTLWDFQGNSRAVLAELCDEFLGPHGVHTNTFIPAYEEVNARLWGQLDGGVIPKEVLRAMRFKQALLCFGIDDGTLARQLEECYMQRCPARTLLMPGALDLLRDLQPHYRMHIISNGFTDIQAIKLAASGIRAFFHVVLTSEMAGASKPSARIFRHALRSAGAQGQESLMIGDNARTDIAGGRNAGMDQVHFATRTEFDPEATYQITHLNQLREILL